MTPGEIRKQTIAQLRKIVTAMMSPEWDLALEGQSKAAEAKAAKLLLKVQRTRLRLMNAELKDIRDKLKANETALNQGTQSLQGALGNLQDVQRVLDATTAFVQIAAKIAAFV